MVAASVEDVASLEAYLAGPTRADTPEPAKGGIAEKLQFALGVPLLAAVTVWCFSQGGVLMGIFLLLCLAFATILLVFMLKDDGSPRDAAVSSGEKAASSLDSLRAFGELDVAARGFPHEAQCPGDHIRFGNGYAFDHDQHVAYSYAQVQRLQVKGLTQGG